MLMKIEEKLNSFNIKTYYILFLICTISIITKIYFALETHAPTPDLLVYLIEATQFSNGEFEIGNRFVWPLFLSIFFNLFDFDTLIQYANLMKIISVTISTITIPIIFLISSKIVGRKWALVASFLYGIEPNIIENSTFAIKEPMFILLGLISIYFILHENKKLIPLAFLFAGLSLDTKIIGVSIVVILILACILRIKNNKELAKILIIGILIFMVTSFPYFITPLFDEKIPIFYQLSGIDKVVSGEIQFTATYSEDEESTTENILKKSLLREFLHLLRINFPILFIFSIFGLYLLLKKINYENKVVIISIVSTYIFALPIYLLSAEFRNLFFITPFLCILSTIAIKKLYQKMKFKNIFLIMLLSTLFIISLIFLIEQFSVDNELFQEKEKMGKYIIENFTGNFMGSMYGDLSLKIENPNLGNTNLNEPHIFNEKIGLVVAPLPIDSKEKLVDLIKIRKIDYLIIDNNYDVRYRIFEDIIKNETEFPFLKKILDSNDIGYNKLKIKIFKIELKQ